MISPRSLSNYDNNAGEIPLSECLAKTIRSESDVILLGQNVFTHCYVVGLVARELIFRQPDWLREALFPAGSELIAAVHDVGKISPTFQKKIQQNLNNNKETNIPGVKEANPRLESQWGGHAGVSQATVDGVGKYIPEIIGRHHGKSPNNSYIATDQVFGGANWQGSREKLIEELKLALTSNWPKVRDTIHASVLSGLTTVADWIGSGELFEYSDQEDSTSLNSLVANAVDHAGFVRPSLRSGLKFQSIFDFPPKLAQNRLIEAAKSPGVYVLEAPMGLGKTEAALFVAYQAMLEGRSTGIYFALPTQLTSDRIHERMNAFLQSIIEQDDPHRLALLLHGAAWLNNTTMGEECQPGNSWFSSLKRGLLAPFAVGTIDQALMAVMNVKHGFIRTFGLAGKVVILDEVHTYDSYTGTLLDNLVKALREIECTVIILSATLTSKRRNILMGLEQNNKKQSKSYPFAIRHHT
ncbi:MAG: CRISPR-associated endonuclease Cas3'', partial [Calditrichia bacterium]|nr:CRISPR-associated endonuclease Cas3'' [Calditrichia bacterium]